MKIRRWMQALFKESTNNGWIQLFRYAFVGGAAFLADFGLLAALTELVGLNYLLSAALSFIVGLIVNYLLSVQWVFASRKLADRRAEFLVFTLIGLVGLGLNELCIWLFTEFVGWHYLVSKIVTTAIVFFWNFLARRAILFSRG